MIHAGYFPSRSKVLEFARYVYELILETHKAIVSVDAGTVTAIGDRIAENLDR